MQASKNCTINYPSKYQHLYCLLLIWHFHIHLKKKCRKTLGHQEINPFNIVTFECSSPKPSQLFDLNDFLIDFFKSARKRLDRKRWRNCFDDHITTATTNRWRLHLEAVFQKAFIQPVKFENRKHHVSVYFKLDFYSNSYFVFNAFSRYVSSCYILWCYHYTHLFCY